MGKASSVNDPGWSLGGTDVYQDLHIRTQDDTVLILRRFDLGKQDAVLVVPDVSETIDDAMQFVHTLGLHCNVYLLELRGHGLSEGRWSSQTEKTDVAYIASLIKKRYRTFILTKGTSAALLLNQDADGLIVISPKKSLPVRVHTPTIAINTHFTSIFGDVRFFQAQHLQLHHVISTALHDLQMRERPIAVRRPKAR